MPNNFFCPACKSDDSLEITYTADAPADKDFDDISLQLIQCNQCGRKGVALYQESRRGQLDSESITHTGYWLDSPDRFPIERG